jgi:hypothetical protein
VVILDFDKLAVRKALAAPGAGSSLCTGYLSGVNVKAPATTMLEIGALAALTTAADDYLVNARAITLARDEPDAMLELNLAGVVPVNFLAAKDAGGDTANMLEVGGGWVRALR